MILDTPLEVALALAAMFSLGFVLVAGVLAIAERLVPHSSTGGDGYS